MQDCVKEVRDLESSYEDINALIELMEEEEDREMIKEIQREIAKFEKEFEDLRIRTLLSGEYDSCNAIVTLHAGAGGTGKGKDNIQVCRCGFWNSQYF